MTPEQMKSWLERALELTDDTMVPRELLWVLIQALPVEQTPTNDGRPKRATCLTEDWILPEEWAKWAKENGCDDPLKEADIFRDYWSAKSGKDASKKSWLATWRNWIRRGYSAPEATMSKSLDQWTLKDWHERLTSDAGGYMRMSKTWANMPGPNPWDQVNLEIPQDVRDKYGKPWGWKKS